MSTSEPPYAAFIAFAVDLSAKFAARARGQPEDQLRGPLETLLKAAGASFSKAVVAKGESRLEGRLGRPDYAILVDGALSGYIELKSPGHGANPNTFKGSDREQWQRFKSIPNLLYTDGNEWGLYRDGEREGKIARLPGDVSQDGGAAVDESSVADVTALLADFFSWQPIVPASPAHLAEVLAPLCRLLRDQVKDSLGDPNSPLVQLAVDWRALLFPDADDEQFADAYAQTVTYALLLAKADGAPSLDAATAAATLGTAHGLLARALQVLTDPAVDIEIGSALRLLERTIGAITPATLSGKAPDPWLYFYENFLAAYDPKLRKNAGVYYTPVEVVRCQVRIADDLLRTRLAKPKGLAEAGVHTLDPALGTGTYLLAAITHSLAEIEARYGPGAVEGEATGLASRLHGFELLVGPYAVAQLRVSREIKARGGSLPPSGPEIFLTDTLEDPATVPAVPALFHAPMAAEHKRAQRVKDTTPILVCIGNPPYDRHDAASPHGGWVRHGAKGVGAPLDDFTDPAKKAGYGVHLKNIYNLYVYFWRWAIWKVFEHAAGPGIVTFISASSYLAGPAFVGMRERLRRECDEVWIIDLGGDNRGPRQEPNVFDIQLPVAIAVAVRFRAADRATPATVNYTRLRGDRTSKLAALDRVTRLDDLAWERCPSGWHDPMRPVGVGTFFLWPSLTDLMPWGHSGVEVKRSWPIGPDDDTLRRRWESLLASKRRASELWETSDRKIDRAYSSSTPALPGGGPLASEPADGAMPATIDYAFRSFDRQRLIADNRVIDRPRPALWRTHGGGQVYLTTLTTPPLGDGPAVTACADIPDRHHFRGSFGGRDVLPLWRDAAATEANIRPGLLDAWSKAVGLRIGPTDFLAYVYALLACPAYTTTFYAELETPGARVPLTVDRAAFEQAIAVGEELLFLHTFGRRYRSPSRRLPHGVARSTVAVASDPDKYPNEFVYDAAAKELRVGTGVFAPVSPEVWSWEISGLRVVASWLHFRMKDRGGKKSSPLDDIRPESWTPAYTNEMLELLWILERTIALAPIQAKVLGDVIAGPLFDPASLPPVPEEQRRPPPTALAQSPLFGA